MTPVIPPIFPAPNPYDRILQPPVEKSYEDTPDNFTLETRLDPEAPNATETAEKYLQVVDKVGDSRNRLATRRLDKAAKEVVKIASLQLSEDSDPVAYDEAIASGLVDPYSPYRRGDRIAMAKIMAHAIIEGRTKPTQYYNQPSE